MNKYTTETWKPILGYEDRYAVSNLGRVKGLARVTVRKDGVVQNWKEKILSPSPDGLGYLFFRVRDGKGGHEMRKVHLCVLESFVGPRPEGMMGCHNNGDNQDNRLENLRWDTPSANMQDKAIHGTNFMMNKTHCAQGHEYTPENTYWRKYTYGRSCKTCQNIRNRKRRERNIKTTQ
ncbi:NUMOD4 motif-containing HNH endonuclease [Rhodococcus ruber]|uniref:NUMOD4 motif-containing HNH endonuclease n=1 Tax=Rhodococcus ruber TaxID=1830 RepID=UPI0022B44724|nr:NUMOD4 motif-containing HNH endonuclease [Rhodococcus ruber]MCZ4505940.1 NUMOD4 motif-containing HNH endonuclease [Rhodococcus ruber]